MIKNLFLKYKSRSNGATKEHCTYIDSSSIGILYNLDEFDKASVSELEQLFKADGKNVVLMGYAEKPVEDSLVFWKKDISLVGTIKKDNLNFFIDQSFDFLIALDTSENMNFRYILALTKASCKLGFETEGYYELLQLALKKEKNSQISLNNLVKYLKMI